MGLSTKGAASMPAQQVHGSSLMIESLECRRLLAVSLEGQTLVITGTKKRDNIQVTAGPDQIRVEINGSVRRFTIADVEQINIQAGQGDDVVHLDNGKVDLTQPARIYGSGGDDTLTGGRGKDRIYGGSGDDVIEGGNARDVLYGEDGADQLFGQKGNDYMDGGDDNDTLTGGAGIDRLLGGRGNDRFNMADGEPDSANGNSGIDSANADDVLDDLTSVENA
jgi:Ca2+-binding RTX toxin-like protein